MLCPPHSRFASLSHIPILLSLGDGGTDDDEVPRDGDENRHSLTDRRATRAPRHRVADEWCVHLPLLDEHRCLRHPFAEISRLENSLAHLRESNDALREALTEEEDVEARREFADAVQENEQTMSVP